MLSSFRFLFTVLAGLSCTAFGFQPLLINGTLVASGDFDEVVKMGGCTATIVGPRAILTAGHCVNEGGSVSFVFKGAKYTATSYRSRFFVGKNHDIGIAVLKTDIPGAKPFNVGGVPAVKSELRILGYGCHTNKPEHDGKLREGKAAIESISGYHLVSSSPGGATLCYGDSGGPAFIEDSDGFHVVGVNSATGLDAQGKVAGPNFNTNTTHADSVSFLNRIAKEQKVEICGITQTCPY